MKKGVILVFIFLFSVSFSFALSTEIYDFNDKDMTEPFVLSFSEDSMQNLQIIKKSHPTARKQDWRRKCQNNK